MKPVKHESEKASQLLRGLRAIALEEKAAFLPKFFKTGPGEYGEGDRFLGVAVPQQRALAKQFRTMSLDEIHKALMSPWHEMRLTALFIFQRRFESADLEERDTWIEFYLSHTDRINNWDLVDSSAPGTLGVYVRDLPDRRKILAKLSRSQSLWEQRIAIVATLTLIKAHDFGSTLEIAERFLTHEHDLIHKATGWMLREVGERDVNVLRLFLDHHASRMPRTMLRYSIEKFSEPLRQGYLCQGYPARRDKPAKPKKGVK